jgi:hypothetical protein
MAMATRSAMNASTAPCGWISLATLLVRASSSPGSSPGSTGVDARRPCSSRLRLALVRPCPVCGPVDFLAFSRLARVGRRHAPFLSGTTAFRVRLSRLAIFS